MLSIRDREYGQIPALRKPPLIFDSVKELTYIGQKSL